ncbi:MAG: peptide ABC transporter substrate-binding protein [Fimbriimonadaceae bacterium]|nr:peptide ABC transporter substrate-binding protein [Fimbriimonadaceae bacterium]QYK55259.1 MAG: peptide ABC transporter substrate-binding protein [Fimbriimonadaceae bacterium]
MRVSAILAVSLLTLLVGCQPGKFSEGQASKGPSKAFRYPIVTNPTTMDPHLVQDGDTIDLLQQVYEGLVGWDEDSKPTGYLAEKWEVSPDGKTYTFTLRDAKFHNGRAVTAADVKWSLERTANPKLASPVADAYLGDILGVKERIEGSANEISGVKVVDDKTVEITLVKPTPYFLGKLTFLTAAVLPKESVPAETAITQVSQMIGAGPFKVKTYLAQQSIILEANKDYHGGAPLLESIERPVIGDAVTRLNKYKNGELDLVMLERQDVAPLQKDEKFKNDLKLFQRPAIWYVGLNQNVIKEFKDKRVRQAVAKAIDKQRIVDELLGGINSVANGIVPPGVPGGGRPEAAAHKYDVASAKALLGDAGYPGGIGFPALTLTFREDRPDIKLVAEAVASDLKKNLGIDVKLQTMEWGAYLEKYNAKKQGFFHMRWAADYLDPQNFLSHMLATWGPENKIGYSNAAFDELCRQADTLQDMDARLPLYAQAEDLVLDDAVWIPIYFQRDAELIRPQVAGLRESLFGHLPHTKVSIGE